MSTLPLGPITISYNGFTFPVETSTEDFQMRPVYDTAGRTVKYVEHSLTIKAVLGEVNQGLGQTTDSTMETLKKVLTAAGGNLKYQGVGVGTGAGMDINPPAGGGVRDVSWGPKPQMLRWRPYGQAACEVVWQVTFCVPLCDTAQYQTYPMEFCYSVSYSIDESGYTKRTYAGHVSVPQTRATQGTRTLLDQADRLRENIQIPLVYGFRRVPGDFSLSEDKCKLTFSIVDIEVGPEYMPPDVVDCKLSHHVSSGKVFTGRYMGTIQGSYELRREVDRATAMRHFLNFASARMLQARLTQYRDLRGQVAQNAVIPIAFSASHPEVYGRAGAAFSLTYSFSSRLSDLVAISGLWSAVPDSNWATWSQSLSSSAFHLRGTAKQAFLASGDVLVDLCQTGTATPVGQPAPDRELGAELLAEGPTPQPPPETSWLHFDSKVRLRQRDHTISLKTLPQSKINLQQPPASLPAPSPPSQTFPPAPAGEAGVRPAGAAIGLDATRVASIAAYPPNQPPDQVVQVRSQPDFEVVLEGGAVRAGYQITPPAVLSVGGRQVVPMNREDDGFDCRPYASWFGLPVYVARWRLTYRVVGTPGQEPLPVIDDPRFGS